MMKFLATKAARRVALLCGLLGGGSVEAMVTDIDNAELEKLMSTGVPLVDIRTAAEWQQTGIIPGSHLLTFFDAQGRANPAVWLQQAGAIAKPGEPLILVCRTGNRTKMLGQFLSEQAGYTKVYNVRSGIVAWAREGRKVVPAAPNLAN